MPETKYAAHQATGSPNGRMVLAWDLPTRLFHWLLVVLIALSYVSRHWGDAGLVWHKWNGYAILVLIVWRVLWGFAGTSTARFRSFFYWPWTAASYGIDFLFRRPRHFLGHNPLGGSMVFVLLGLVGLQGVLGLYSYDDHTAIAGGPLAGKVADETWAAITKWHIWIFDIILIAIALHILANVLYLVWKRENLVKPMITGKKLEANFEDHAEARVETIGRALVCLIAAVLLVFGGIMTLGGKIF